MTVVSSPGTITATSSKARWVALAVVCAGSLVNVLDTTIVGVALPAIRADLGFSQPSLSWVVNAYLLTYGGFLLLGGRLGDLYGYRKLFVIGIGGFTVASLLCGLSTDQGMLLAARAVQGLAGAIASAAALSLVVALFPEPADRAEAMGIFGFVSAGGGSIGVLAGGALTSLASWHWIFLVNVPIGVVVCVASLRVVPQAEARQGRGRLDVPGAVLVTGAVLAAVYGITNAGQAGWSSPRTVAALTAAVVLAAAFATVESRSPFPLVPPLLLRVRNLLAASVTGILWTAGMFAMFFLTTQYLQLVLGYSPFAAGLAFLPSSLLMAIISMSVSARLVARFGIRISLVGGLLLVAIGLALLGHAPVGGHFATDVLPSMILLGLGAGVAGTSLLLAGTGAVAPQDAGLASGITNVAVMLGGALGLAVLASLAAARTQHLTASGSSHLAALTGGYHLAYLAGAACAAVGALLSATWLRPSVPAQAELASEPELGLTDG